MKKYFRYVLAGLLVFTLSGAPAFAGPSATASVALSLNVNESLTLSATPPSIAFTYDGVNSATASGPISVTTSWSLDTGHTNLAVYAYFASTTALSGPQSIPTSEVIAAIDSQGPAACNQSNGQQAPGTACNTVYQVANPTQTGTKTDSVTLSLSGTGALLPGTYSGMINFQADVI